MEAPRDRPPPIPKEDDNQPEYIKNSPVDSQSPEDLIQIRTHDSLLRSLEKNYLLTMQQWNKS